MRQEFEVCPRCDKPWNPVALKQFSQHKCFTCAIKWIPKSQSLVWELNGLDELGRFAPPYARSLCWWFNYPKEGDGSCQYFTDNDDRGIQLPLLPVKIPRE